MVQPVNHNMAAELPEYFSPFWRTSEIRVSGGWAQLQNCNFTFLSCEIPDLLSTPKKKTTGDKILHYPLNLRSVHCLLSWHLQGCPSQILVRPGSALGRICSILGTCGWGGREVCVWASAPLGAGCHSATKTSIILSVRIVENFFWVIHA